MPGKNFGKISRFREFGTGAIILVGACAVMWLFMIRPHSYDWQAAGQARGTVKSLISNQTVIGAPAIKAVVNLPSGRAVIIEVPLESDIRAGTEIILSVQVDAENTARKRYTFSRAAP